MLRPMQSLASPPRPWYDALGSESLQPTLAWKGSGVTMSFTTWVKSLLSHRGKAIELYRSGMAKAKQRDYEGAIADYTAAIAATQIPNDVKAMAVYNRGLAYSATHEDAKAAEDLAALLEMPDLPENIRTAAQQRRERIRRRNESDDSS